MNKEEERTNSAGAPRSVTALTHTVAFSGIDVLKVNIEVQLSNGLPSFAIVGLPDKAVAESKERVRAALHSLGIMMPSKHIIVNLAPADVAKEGTHYDLPIIMALLSAMGIVAKERVAQCMMLGELGLDGSIRSVCGVLPAALKARQENMIFVCPEIQAGEAVWAETPRIVPALDVKTLILYMQGKKSIPSAQISAKNEKQVLPDLIDVKGQSGAKRALEIAAVGGHNMLMIGPPGSGKSMLASRLPSLLPVMTKREMLEVSQIHSVAGKLKEGQLVMTRPYRAPHHSATMPSLVGGGTNARPGEISLAHRGVLFLDELPEFSRATLEALRQPIETGVVSISRANAHVSYPARFQLVAAMNPCRCGYLGLKNKECPKAPKCGAEYQAKISGPLLDRIDLQLEVPAVNPWELAMVPQGESSAQVAERVKSAIMFSQERFKGTKFLRNAELDGVLLAKLARLEPDAEKRLRVAAEKFMLSARGYHRVIRVARTIADLAHTPVIQSAHIVEALTYRNPFNEV